MPLKRIEIVANPASGRCGPTTGPEAEAILAEFGFSTHARLPGGDCDLDGCVRQALAAGPDLLVVIAGDGTARAACELAGPDGPMVAPLPGGTMNILPKALYGDVTWQEALRAMLTDGEEKVVSGGAVDGHSFYVAAMLGTPALWADAREAMREGRPWIALQRARRAWRRAFSGKLRVSLEGGPREAVEALAVLCPLVSAALDEEERVLEVAALDPAGALEAARLGARTLVGTWREDPSVTVRRCRVGKAWSKGSIPATLDGEPVRLKRQVDITFRPKAFRAYVPRKEG